jgi:hypothetical protein
MSEARPRCVGDRDVRGGFAQTAKTARASKRLRSRLQCSALLAANPEEHKRTREMLASADRVSFIFV